MKSFKEFSLNIAPKDHKIVKVLDSKSGEVMVTKDKEGKFNVMFDNQPVDTVDTEREAMRSAKNFQKLMGKSSFKGASSSKLLRKKNKGGYFK
jgi:hypothetical protein